MNVNLFSFILSFHWRKLLGFSFTFLLCVWYRQRSKKKLKFFIDDGKNVFVYNPVISKVNNKKIEYQRSFTTWTYTIRCVFPFTLGFFTWIKLKFFYFTVHNIFTNLSTFMFVQNFLLFLLLPSIFNIFWNEGKYLFKFATLLLKYFFFLLLNLFYTFKPKRMSKKTHLIITHITIKHANIHSIRAKKIFYFI